MFPLSKTWPGVKAIEDIGNDAIAGRTYRQIRIVHSMGKIFFLLQEGARIIAESQTGVIYSSLLQNIIKARFMHLSTIFDLF